MNYTDEQIGDFIREHCPHSSTWKPEYMLNWIKWAIHERFMLFAGTEEALLGLLIVRPVFHSEKAYKDVLEHDPEGDTYYVDMAIALPPKRPVLQCLGFAMIKRYGMKDKIAFQKHGEGPIYVVDAHMHREKLLRQMKEVLQ